MKIPKSDLIKIVSINHELSLCQPIPALAPYFFDVLTRHRTKMLKWSGFAATIKNTKDADQWIKEIHLFNQGGQKFNSIIIWKDQFAGMIALHRIDKMNKRAEIGYWINHDHQGNGLIPIVMNPFLNHVFDNVQINRIDLIVAKENVKSVSVAQKTGFIQEGALKEYFIINEICYDALIFRMLRSDFKQIE